MSKFPAVEFEALTVRRKADREKIAAALAAIAVEYGFTASPSATDRGRQLTVCFTTLRGLKANIWLNGESTQLDVHIVNWYTATNSEAKIAAGFADSVNPYHWGKATDVCHGWRELAACVRDAFDSIKDGSAFQ